jgi:hypothetical protein
MLDDYATIFLSGSRAKICGGRSGSASQNVSEFGSIRWVISRFDTTIQEIALYTYVHGYISTREGLLAVNYFGNIS